MMSLQSRLLLFLLLITGTFRPVRACTCDGWPDLAEAMQDADLVCSGTVVSSVYSTHYDSLGLALRPQSPGYSLTIFSMEVVRLKVDKIYKGTVTADTITMLTAWGDATCGYHFEAGQSYIVYSTLREQILGTYQSKEQTRNTFWTSLCRRNQRWNQQEDNAISAWLRQ